MIASRYEGVKCPDSEGGRETVSFSQTNVKIGSQIDVSFAKFLGELQRAIEHRVRVWPGAINAFELAPHVASRVHSGVELPH
jgi:hypothetical protein